MEQGLLEGDESPRKEERSLEEIKEDYHDIPVFITFSLLLVIPLLAVPIVLFRVVFHETFDIQQVFVGIAAVATVQLSQSMFTQVLQMFMAFNPATSLFSSSPLVLMEESVRYGVIILYSKREFNALYSLGTGMGEAWSLGLVIWVYFCSIVIGDVMDCCCCSDTLARKLLSLIGWTTKDIVWRCVASPWEVPRNVGMCLLLGYYGWWWLLVNSFAGVIQSVVRAFISLRISGWYAGWFDILCNTAWCVGGLHIWGNL